MTRGEWSFHLAIPIDAMLKMSREELVGACTADPPLTYEQIVMKLLLLRRQGLTYLPVCDATGADGSCLGHPKQIQAKYRRPWRCLDFDSSP
jgi:hypothetical protein